MAIAALLILAAIPQFNNYRGAARDASTVSDVKNVAVAMEAWSIDHPGSAYPFMSHEWRNEPDVRMDVLNDLGVTLSDGTRIWIQDRFLLLDELAGVPATGFAFCIFAYNDNGQNYSIPDRPGAAAYSSQDGGFGIGC